MSNILHKVKETLYKYCSGIMIVYDMTNQQSFDNVINWYNEAKLYEIMPNAKIMLVANKCDLISDTVIPSTKAKDLCNK